MDELVTFQRYGTIEEAQEAASALRARGIETVIQQDPSLLDSNFVGQRFDDPVQLKILTGEFKKAMQVLIDTYKVNLADIPKDYMLLSFSTEELKDVIAKPDEWGPYNYNIAIALLNERGTITNSDNLDTVVQDRSIALSQPRELTPALMLFGYGFSVIGIAAELFGSKSVLMLLYGFFLGIPGLLGAILGIYIFFIKRTLVDGTRMYSFTSPARKHGLVMIVLALIPWLLVFLSRFV